MAERDQLQDRAGDFQTVLWQLVQPVVETLRSAWHRMTHMEESSFLLGCQLVEQGLYAEALWRFRFVCWRRPHHAQAWYNRAVCHFALGESLEGVEALRKSLAIRPNDEVSLFLLATIEGGRYADPLHLPHTMPPQLVQNEFGSIAEEYDIILLSDLDYRAPLVIPDMLDGLLPHGRRRFLHMLDAGCGSGLMGTVLRSSTEQLTGVDCVPQMIEKAKTKQQDNKQPVYDTLTVEDLRTHLLQGEPERYDCIILLEVADIIGGLAPVMDGLARSLMPGGIAVMSIRLITDAQETGYRLNKTERRFEHSNAYLRGVMERSGLEPVSLREVPLYADDSRHVAVIRKPV